MYAHLILLDAVFFCGKKMFLFEMKKDRFTLKSLWMHFNRKTSLWIFKIHLWTGRQLNYIQQWMHLDEKTFPDCCVLVSHVIYTMRHFDWQLTEYNQFAEFTILISSASFFFSFLQTLGYFDVSEGSYIRCISFNVI